MRTVSSGSTGTSSALPPVQVDLATMTGNVAQVFIADSEWRATLDAIHEALVPGGCLVFESRVPSDRAWLRWTREDSYTRAIVLGVGAIERWAEVTDAGEGQVSFRSTFVFESEEAVLTSDSTLRFRSKEELTNSLAEANLIVREVRDAPDRPGREFVFIASRSEEAAESV